MTGGTEAGYRKVLAQFYKDAGERLPFFAKPPFETVHGEDQFSPGKLDRQGFNLGAFTTQAHALKSAAGTIGAAEVSKEAAALEAAGKSGDTAVIAERLPGFYRRLAELIDAIKKEEREELTTDHTNGGQGLVLKEKLVSLKAALEAKNIDEIDRIIAELEATPLDKGMREGINGVSDNVLMGEYGNAKKGIDDIINGDLLP
jgi:HPt (histidine-containing phosphotransfer) domain-containing protein